MRTNIFLLTLLLSYCFPSAVSAQIYSFEDGKVPDGWHITQGKLTVSPQRYKLGYQSLQVAWQAGAVLTLPSPQGITQACKSSNGGITTWIYNESPLESNLTFSFKDKEGKEVCQLPYSLNFKGWRCLWAKFREDMRMNPQAEIQSVEIQLPRTAKDGTFYLDYLEFPKTVSWQKMSDAQYKVNQKDYSLISNFIGYRETKAAVANVQTAQDNEISVIEKRLTEWYLGSGAQTSSEWIALRQKNEQEYIRKGLQEAKDITIAYSKDGTPIGEGLFPMCAPNAIDGNKIKMFRNINEKVLIPLALDYRKNKNPNSLKKALYIYDWYNDQGWADGSGLGTLCFEKLRSSGYFHSFFLLKDKLTSEQLERELKALQWFTMFGTCYQKPTHTGEVADNLRALALPKLIYALSLTDKQERQVALTAYKSYMDNALGLAPGYFGTIKPDFSGYHHRGPYHSAYYPHALYAGALVAYLLHDTPYALSKESMNNLKQGLLTFRFFCADLDVSAGTVGRFPTKQQILETLLPAFAYVALSQKEPDKELTAAYKRILSSDVNGATSEYIQDVHSNLTYTSSVGEVELMEKLQQTHIAEEPTPSGSLFMPYSGVMIAKDANTHFNFKGFSRYIWDFESSANENTKGRYLAYGQIEYFDFKNKRKSFNPQEKDFNWNYIPGATTKVLPDAMLQDKGGSSSGHRNFSDESFLTGVHASDQTSMFSFRMHDITYDKSFRANKSVFVFGDLLVCLGSDVQNTDSRFPTVTTLFQSFNGEVKDERTPDGHILNEPSFIYAVKEGQVQVDRKGAYTLAYINHSTAPASVDYEYYIVKDKNSKLAQHLLSTDSPIEIVAQNNDAHIVHHKEKEIVCGALFNATKEYNEQVVKQVNIPLSFVLEKEQEKGYKLSICEPDMRRAARAHMGLLTEEDVIEQEKPFDTSLTLSGIYVAKCDQKPVKATHNKEKNETTVTISTIRGENYTLSLEFSK